MNEKNNRRRIETYRQKMMACKKCQGQNFDCTCRYEFEIGVRKVLSQLPWQYDSISLKDIRSPEVKAAKAEVTAYINELDDRFSKGHGLYLWGSNGTAKTSMASIILDKALRKHHGSKTYSVFYVQMGTYIDALYRSFGGDDEDFKNLERKLLTVDFLVIDDLGGLDKQTNRNNRLIESSLTWIVKNRCNGLLPTIITSNLKLKDLQDMYGQRLYSVIRQFMKPIQCGGADYRTTVLAQDEVEATDDPLQVELKEDSGPTTSEVENWIE